MSEMIDMRDTVIAKSDQLNAEDLISGDKILKITGVKKVSDPQQPIVISYEGDNGKPYKPCLTMRRLLMHSKAWGINGADYIGRKLAVYNNERVKWAGQEQGGIRIAAMSDIESDFTIMLTVTRGKKEAHKVRKLIDAPENKLTDDAKADLISKLESASTMNELSMVASEIKSLNLDKEGRDTMSGQYKTAVARVRGMIEA